MKVSSSWSVWTVWITSVVCQLGLPVSLSASTEGWQVHWSEAYQPTSSLVITLVEPEHWEQAHSRIDQEGPGSGFLFAQIPVFPDTHSAVADTLNTLLNKGPGFGLRHVYMLVVGSKHFAQTVAPMKSDIFPKAAHWSTDQPLADSTWVHGYFEHTPLQSMVSSFHSVYLWPYTLDKIRAQVPIDVPATKPNVYLGYSLVPTQVIAANTDAYVVDGFTQHAIQVRTDYSERFSLEVDLAFSLNFPKPESAIQQAVMSQVDFADLASGSDVEVTLNETFRGHVYGSASIALRRTFLPEAVVQPYVSLGLGFDLLASFEQHLDTTLVINSADFTSGGGGDRPTPSQERSPEGALFTLAVPFAAGLSAPLGERLSATGEAGVRLSMNAVDGSRATVHLPYLSFGLSYRLTNRKPVPFYRYVGM